MVYRVFVTDPAVPLAQAFLATADQVPWLEVASGDPSTDWRHAPTVAGRIAAAKPNLVINTAGWVDDVGPDDPDFYLQSATNIAEQCHANSAALIQFSNFHVFKGDKSGYIETDDVDPRDSFGELMLAAERAVTACERHKIIRLSWVIGWQGENLMTKIAGAAAHGGDATIIAERRGAPVSHADIGRMLNAVIRQLAFGAENWGVFHYGAANVCTEEAFAQAVLKWLATLDIGTGAVVDVSDNDYEPTSAALGYKRLLDNYGIQPRKWKQMLKAELEAWSQQREVICN